MAKRETQPGSRNTILPITKLSKLIDTHKVHGNLSNKDKEVLNNTDTKTISERIAQSRYSISSPAEEL